MFKKKALTFLAIVVGVLAAWIISGCTTSPAPVVSSADSSIIIQLDHQYPQMYTPVMLKNMGQIEKDDNITWLGCYDDGIGAFLLWHNDNETGKCHAAFIVPPSIEEISCDDAWELYLEVCKDLGNCQQLI